MLDTSDQELRSRLLEKLIDQKLTGPTKQIMDCDPRRLEERELPHGNVANLYVMYLAYCRTSNLLPAGKTTFYGVAQEWLSTCLRFMRKCTHAVCWTCSTLRAAIRNAGDFEAHARLTDQLLGHYTEMYRDREIYWMSRERSQAQGDVLTVILDSYDKAKIQLPRFPGTRVPKKAVYEALKRSWAQFKIAICLPCPRYVSYSYMRAVAWARLLYVPCRRGHGPRDELDLGNRHSVADLIAFVKFKP